MGDVVDYFFNQHHSKDFMQITGSVVIPQLESDNLKRFSVDPVLSMFIKESPNKIKNEDK